MTTATPTGRAILIGIRINVDGTMEDVRIDGTTDSGRVEALNRAVGSGVFDIVGLPESVDVFVDDEGLYRAEHNPVLSMMVRDLLGAPVDYRLHGAGVFLGTDEATGETRALTPAQRAIVATAWFAAAPIAAL